MRLETRPRRPAFDRDINIGRIDVEPTEAPTGPFGCQERRSGAQEEIEHEIAAPRHIQDSVGDKPRRLDRGVQGEILPSATAQGIYRGIVPDVGAVAAMPAELDHIEVGRRSDAVDKDQFMFGAVQRSHSSIRLVPDAQVQPLAIHRAADGRDVVHMPPVHADKVDGAVARNTRRGPQRIGQEGAKLRLAHLARGHGELAIDAKYRDIWEKGFPARWLYQLSIYALASHNQASILLYGTMSTDARDERIDIRQPIWWSSKGAAFLILRPVPLQRMAELLGPSQRDRSASERKRFADELVAFDVNKPKRERAAGGI